MPRDFELRELLKSQSLDDVKPSAFASVGGVVFPDEPAKFDLADFVDVVESYRAVHVPTYGNAIPNTVTNEVVSMSTSKTSIDLLEVPTNQTYKILGISVRGASTDYEMTGAALKVNNFDIIDLNTIDTITQTFGAVLVNPESNLILTGGSALSFACAQEPNATVTFDIVYHKLQQ